MNFKCAHNTARVKVTFNHQPLECIENVDICQYVFVQSSLALMQHYRDSCVAVFKNDCERIINSSVVDGIVRENFYDDVKSNMAHVREQLTCGGTEKWAS